MLGVGAMVALENHGYSIPCLAFMCKLNDKGLTIGRLCIRTLLFSHAHAALAQG